jgi:hypothetical protein
MFGALAQAQRRAVSCDCGGEGKWALAMPTRSRFQRQSSDNRKHRERHQRSASRVICANTVPLRVGAGQSSIGPSPRSGIQIT